MPAALVGTERVQPIGARLPRLRSVTVRYGQPLDVVRYDGLANCDVIRRAVTGEVMAAIATPLQQAYGNSHHRRPAA